MVVDDLQSVTDTGCLRSLDHAVAAFPGNVQLILLSRSVPRLRLARLRALGQLAELGPSDLAFTVGWVFNADGQTLGKYFSVWQKQNTGNWLYVVD